MKPTPPVEVENRKMTIIESGEAVGNLGTLIKAKITWGMDEECSGLCLGFTLS